METSGESLGAFLQTKGAFSLMSWIHCQGDKNFQLKVEVYFVSL